MRAVPMAGPGIRNGKGDLFGVAEGAKTYAFFKVGQFKAAQVASSKI